MRVSELYKRIHAPVLVTDPASAEMIKYASNAFLATKVSFINAIANLCEAVDADAREVAIGMGYDTRIGFQFLQPGPGYGGSCFPEGRRRAAAHLERGRLRLRPARRSRQVNEAQHERMIDKVRTAVGGRSHRRDRCAVGPHVQGRHRRPARLACDLRRAAPTRRGRNGARRTTVAPATGPGSSSPGSSCAPTRTRPRAAPKRSCC